MVFTFPMQSFYRPAQLSVDTSNQIPHKYFEDDDGTLDEPVLDSGLEMSPPMIGSRRDSFAIGSSLFSPKHEDWQSVDMQSVSSNNPFDQSATNSFIQMDHQTHPHHPQMVHQGSWPMSASTSANSAIVTTMPQYDGLPTDFQTASSLLQQPHIHASMAYSQPGPMDVLFSPVDDAVVSSAATPTTAMNAASGPESSPSLDSGASGQAGMTKKIPPQSPTLRSHNDLRRGDGIRKKNARFEIPPDRNLNNIDFLIAQSKDELEIKELKQQKRLLRNRQAALDSRQRKKQHTERLEDEKKQYTAVISELEHNLESMKLQVSELLEEKQKYTNYIESLNLDKEELIRRHTNETGELRKKVSVLTNHIQALETAAAAPPMHNHANPLTGAATGMSAHDVGAFNDMNSLYLDDTNSWEQVGLFADVSILEEESPNSIKQESQVPPPRKNISDAVDVATGDKASSQGGLLFMLFLVGAFVLSSRQTPSIPRVSEDVRAASAALLDNVLKDAGVPQSGQQLVQPPSVIQSTVASMPATSATTWTALANAGHELVEPSMLNKLSQDLIQPTEEQTNEQIFSLSAEQYNGVVHYDQGHLHQAHAANREQTSSLGRRNLAEALASMRGNSKADTYTRSLLWDQIPSDVVHTFAKMVAECNAHSPNAEA